MTTSVGTDDVKRLVAEGAQLVDVLPAETYHQEHIHGAINLPLAEVDSATDRLDPSRPVVVYCFDYQ
jgi:rhodanese-related sulfurtransferase